MFTRQLGRSGIDVSAMGLGCWAIGGPIWRDGQPQGWGDVEDDRIDPAIHRALELGITFFDTADVYGAGHSERILGQALAGRRETVVIATSSATPLTRQRAPGPVPTPAPTTFAVRVSQSRRLQTDYIDLYQFHVGNYEPAEAEVVREALEDLVAAGKIRTYGWSTDDPERARIFAQGAHCSAIQQRLNIFEGN